MTSPMYANASNIPLLPPTFLHMWYEGITLWVFEW